MSRLELMARISRAMQYGEATPEQRALLQNAFSQATGDQLPAPAVAVLADLERTQPAK